MVVRIIPREIYYFPSSLLPSYSKAILLHLPIQYLSHPLPLLQIHPLYSFYLVNYRWAVALNCYPNAAPCGSTKHSQLFSPQLSTHHEDGIAIFVHIHSRTGLEKGIGTNIFGLQSAHFWYVTACLRS